jgi:hypothetical protein
MRAAIVAGGLVLAVAVLAAVLHNGSDGETGPTASAAIRGPTPEPTATPSPTAAPRADRQRQAIAARLRAAVNAAGGFGGTATAAVMLDDWRDPVTASSVAGGSRRTVRMWSTSKVVTAVLLLRQLDWGDAAGRPPSEELERALEGALRRSENCRQRRVVLEAQARSGSPAAIASDLADVLVEAGARPLIARRTQGPDALCAGYLGSQRALADPGALTPMLGTSRWRMSDAARFAHALGAGVYGRALGDRVLAIMRAPKLRSRETPAADYTPTLDWGAGAALACGRPAYKAGWGGAPARAFVAEQIAVLRRGNRTAAIAVAFAPAAQPALDDPGSTRAPAAVELVMSRMARDLIGKAC